jgi:hypothetical protein
MPGLSRPKDGVLSHTYVPDIALSFVMPALVAGIHAFLEFAMQDVDGRNKSGHDGGEAVRFTRHGRPFHGVSLSSSWPGLSRA